MVAGKGPTLQRALRARVAALDAEAVHRGRKILVVQGAAGPKWLWGLGWDAVFHVKDVTDMKMALTVVQHTAKPVRVFWVGTEPAAAVVAALGKIDQCSLVAVGERAPAAADWQAIFWPPEATVEEVEPAVTARMGGTRGATLRSMLKELAASGIGLVWSSIGESDKRGELYWYDPTEGEAAEAGLDPVDAADTLRAVAEWLTRS
jgi:hypothetical protein